MGSTFVSYHCIYTESKHAFFCNMAALKKALMLSFVGKLNNSAINI